MMNVLRATVHEIVGLFIDDGNLAAFSLILVAVVAASIKLLGLPPLIGAVLLLLGCLAILIHSVFHAAKR